MNIRQEAAKMVVSELGPFELSVDVALARGGRFIAALAEGRLEAQVAPATGHGAIMSALATVAALGQAREGVVATRRELLLTRAKVGLQEFAAGGLMGCPDPTPKKNGDDGDYFTSASLSEKSPEKVG